MEAPVLPLATARRVSRTVTAATAPPRLSVSSLLMTSHSRQQRTLVVLHSAAAAGPPEHVFPWLSALAERGPVTTVVPGEGPAAALYEAIGSTTVLRFERLTYPGLRSLGPQVVRFVADVRAFGRVIRHAAPDVVVVVTASIPAALVAARLQRVATVVFVGEIFDKGLTTSRIRSLAATATAWLTGSTADGIVGCSEAVTRQFDPSRARVIRTIHPGVGESYAGGDGAGFRAAHGLEGAHPCLAVVGNVTRARGQDVAIRALPALRERFPAVRCVFAGVPHPLPADLAYRQELTSLARRLGVEDLVSFVGLVAPIADLYAATDIVVNPARFNEPFGRVAIEALSAGCPVVAARVGAIPEIVRDGREALLFDAEDHDALEQAVTRLWSDPRLREEFVRNGRRRVAEVFGEEEAVEAFADVIDRILRARSTATAPAMTTAAP